MIDAALIIEIDKLKIFQLNSSAENDSRQTQSFDKNNVLFDLHTALPVHYKAGVKFFCKEKYNIQNNRRRTRSWICYYRCHILLQYSIKFRMFKNELRFPPLSPSIFPATLIDEKFTV